MTDMFSHLRMLAGALRGSEQNHRVLSQNIANVNTPGYQTRRVNFEELIEQLQVNDGQMDLKVEIAEGFAARLDGNNVDIEREISELKKNALAAQAFSQLLASRVSTMRRAISS